MYNREIGEFHLKNQKNFINYLSIEVVSGSFIFIGQDSIGKKDFACLVSEIILENNENRVNVGEKENKLILRKIPLDIPWPAPWSGVLFLLNLA